MATPTTKHSAIFDYWKDKYINSHGDITSKPDNSESWMEVVSDWCEPSCWGCGMQIDASVEMDGDEFINDGYKKIWDGAVVKKKLNRCHIKPNAIGGEDKPDNLFLMCPQCHKISPDTANSSAFIRWVYNARSCAENGWPKMSLLLENIRKELASRGGKSFEYMLGAIGEDESKNNLIDYRAFYEWAKKHGTTHCNSLSEATLIVLFADYVEEIYKGEVQQ